MILELAERQHGVVARAQLLEIGIARGALDLRLARGRLLQLHHGVYAVGHKCLTPAGQYMAGVLAGGPHAALSHRTAGALWGVWCVTGGEIAVTAAARRRSRAGLRFHRYRLPPDEVTTRERIPVTTITRTLFDLAGVLTAGQLARAAREAEVRRLWDELSLATLLRRHPRRPGAAAIRSLVDGTANVTREELEERFRAFVDRFGLLRPSTNVGMHIGGRWIEADCMWPEQRLIVELDGYGPHGTRASFEADRARDRALIVAGWRVIRITWRQLRDEPENLARDLRAALGQAPS